ncbi:TIGR02186 family protein [Microvirga flavescens]|uniref:TIGR02186 family protein n=1 Tax=Microvirga flavescens TaxID=2249811 RepID=UPI000DDA36DB|nr:TIGR02186 family protein [Microvirga flavescens]
MRMALALLLFFSPAAALAEALITTLSSHRVLITSNYTGTSIAVFGAVERDAQTVARATGYDVVVTVRGPRQSIVVREKERRGLVWLNREQQKFPDAPSYLSVFTSRPLDEIASEPARLRQKIGVNAIVHAADFTNDRGTADEPFREALYRLKSRDGLYFEKERGVTFLTPNIFTAQVPVPASAPTGTYDVEVALLAETVVLARSHTNFELVKIGFEQQVGEAARDASLTYGLATALIALGFGWLASTIFRRD